MVALRDFSEAVKYCFDSTVDFTKEQLKTFSLEEMGKVKTLNEKIKHLTSLLDLAEAFNFSAPGFKEFYANSKLTKKTITIYQGLPQFIDDTNKFAGHYSYAKSSDDDQKAMLSEKQVVIENSFKNGWYEVATTVSSLFGNLISAVKEFIGVTKNYIAGAASFAKKISPYGEAFGLASGTLSLIDAANNCLKPIDAKFSSEAGRFTSENKKYNLTLAHKLLKLADSIGKLALSIIPLIQLGGSLSPFAPAIIAGAVSSTALLPTLAAITILVGLIAKYVKKHADLT
jgi:hypothetical protein